MVAAGDRDLSGRDRGGWGPAPPPQTHQSIQMVNPIAFIKFLCTFFLWFDKMNI